MSDNTQSGDPVLESLRKAHNDLQKQLQEAETDVERAHIRGKRHGLVHAIAVYRHHNAAGSPFPRGPFVGINTADPVNIDPGEEGRSPPPCEGSEVEPEELRERLEEGAYVDPERDPSQFEMAELSKSPRENDED